LTNATSFADDLAQKLAVSKQQQAESQRLQANVIQASLSGALQHNILDTPQGQSQSTAAEQAALRQFHEEERLAQEEEARRRNAFEEETLREGQANVADNMSATDAFKQAEREQAEALKKSNDARQAEREEEQTTIQREEREQEEEEEAEKQKAKADLFNVEKQNRKTVGLFDDGHGRKANLFGGKEGGGGLFGDNEGFDFNSAKNKAAEERSRKDAEEAAAKKLMQAKLQKEREDRAVREAQQQAQREQVHEYALSRSETITIFFNLGLLSFRRSCFGNNSRLAWRGRPKKIGYAKRHGCSRNRKKTCKKTMRWKSSDGPVRSKINLQRQSGRSK
jgi:hypothetical protein